MRDRMSILACWQLTRPAWLAPDAGGLYDVLIQSQGVEPISHLQVRAAYLPVGMA